MTQANEWTLREAVGHQLRRHREREAMTADEVAEAARRWGLPWRRMTVLNVEAGERDITIADLILLSVALDEDLDYWLKGIAPDDLVWLTNDTAAPASILIAALRGKAPKHWRSVGVGWHSPAVGEAERGMKALRGDLDAFDREIDRIAKGEAEQKAAVALGITPTELAHLAVSLWDQGLTTERDRRVNEQTKGKTLRPRSLQATRGHITRQLLDELRHHQQHRANLWEDEP